MLVRADLVTVGHAGGEDELRIRGEVLRARVIGLLWRIRGLESQQELLDDVVAVRMRRQIEDVLGHLSTHRKDLLVEGVGVLPEHLDEDLDSARTVQVHRNLDQRR